MMPGDIPEYDLSDLKPNEYEIKILMHRPRFHQAVRKLREDWNIPSSGFPDNKSENKWRENISDSNKNELMHQIRLLGLELKLSERWDSAIYLFLRTDIPYSLRTNQGNGIRFEYEGTARDPKNIHSVWIQVDSSSTIEEITESFNYAKDMLEEQKKKMFPANLDRNLKVWEMHLRGVRNKDIALWLNANYPGAFDPNHVAKIIKRTKELLK